jgi:hypothetical protein
LAVHRTASISAARARDAASVPAGESAMRSATACASAGSTPNAFAASRTALRPRKQITSAQSAARERPQVR